MPVCEMEKHGRVPLPNLSELAPPVKFQGPRYLPARPGEKPTQFPRLVPEDEQEYAGRNVPLVGF